MQKAQNKGICAAPVQDVVLPFHQAETPPKQGRKRGAPRGNSNAVKSGYHGKAARERRAVLRDFRRRVKQALALANEEIARAYQ